MKTEAEARAELEALGAGLVVVSEYSYHATIPETYVISQDPPAGTLVPPGSTVTLFVSLGPLPAYQSRWLGTQNPITGVPYNQEAAEQPQAFVVVYVDLNIPGDRLRLHTGIPTFKWGGHTWQGVGRLGGIEAVSESLEVLAQPVKLTLSGVDSQYVSALMGSQYHGSNVVVYVGMHDRDTLALIDTPEEVWSGFIDTMYIDVGLESSTIRVDCEHRLRRQPATSRYTDEDQRARFANDRFFDKLHLIPGYTGRWGARDTGYGAGGGAGRGGRSNPREK